VTSDVFEDWRNHRYIVTPQHLLDQQEILIIMTDVNFWAEHVDQCIAWCYNHNCEIKGMTITIPDEATLTLFALRWS